MKAQLLVLALVLPRNLLPTFSDLYVAQKYICIHIKFIPDNLKKYQNRKIKKKKAKEKVFFFPLLLKCNSMTQFIYTMKIAALK